MNTDSETFCAAPWFHARHDNNQQWRCCALIDSDQTQGPADRVMSWPQHSALEYLNSEHVMYIRTQLDQGQRIPECSACWRAESAGTVSLRQRINHLLTNGVWPDKSWINSYFSRKNNWQVDQVFSADIKFGNLCNFNCVMCHPIDSTQVFSHWQKNISNPVLQSRLAAKPLMFLQSRSIKQRSQSLEIIQYMIDSGVRWLQILGGEPLISQSLIHMLSQQPQCVKDRIHLLFITNGSEDLITTRQRLGDYKNITFTVSLEGVGAVQQYMRRGSDWKQCESNIDRYLQSHGHQCLHVAYTLQCLTVGRFHELRRWADERGIMITVTPLVDPDFMSLQALPVPMYEPAYQSLGPISEIFKDVKFDARLLLSLRDWLKFWDPDDHWKSVFPEWQPYLSFPEKQVPGQPTHIPLPRQQS